MNEDYDGREVVEMDLHRRRSVLVRMRRRDRVIRVIRARAIRR